MYIIYERGRRPPSTTRWAAGWTSLYGAHRARFKTDVTCFIPAECQYELFHKRVEPLSRLNSWPCFFTLSCLPDVKERVREMDDTENASQENKVPHATADCV